LPQISGFREVVFTLRRPESEDGGEIPSRPTNGGANVSPPLAWSGAPEGTRSYVLIMEGIDAFGGVFHHSGLYDVEGDRTPLPEGIGHGVKTKSMGHGWNEFDHPRYDGPVPDEADPPHRYVFRLGALDLEVPTKTPKKLVADIWEQAKPHVLAEGTLTGTCVSRHHSERRDRK
jgi:Raf kinase inhibitor-like YbhB/YbcL family protein